MELPLLPVLDPAEFALRVAMRPDPGSWSVLVVPLDEIESRADEVARAVRAFEEREPVRLDVRAGSSSLLSEVARHPTETLVVTGVDSFARQGWEDLDLARSRLMREGEVVLVASPEAVAAMLRFAPHLASWVSSNAWRSSAELMQGEDEARVAERLADLRAWSRGMTDEQVVRMAKEGTLPAEPEFAEWLALLGEGDLVGGR